MFQCQEAGLELALKYHKVPTLQDLSYGTAIGKHRPRTRDFLVTKTSAATNGIKAPIPFLMRIMSL